MTDSATMEQASLAAQRADGEDRGLAAAALLVTALHLLLGGRYDLFRDELYFIVCGQHPAWGYADQPPLVPLLAAALHTLSWSAWPLRVPGALAAGALVWLTGRLARGLGGGDLAVALAALAVAIAPMLLGLTAILSTSLFEPLAWTAVTWLIVRAMRGEPRAMIPAGLVAGVALETRYGIAFWLVGLALGLLGTPQRVLLARRETWIGVALAAAIALPSALWQAAHGFPFLELGKAAAGKNADVPLGAFLANQVVVMNPALAPLWLAGLAAPFLSRRLRDLRLVPLACLVVLVIVRLGHGKDYYLAPLYPTLFAIGAAALAPLLTTRLRRLAAGAVTVAAVTIALVVLPIALPLLSPFTLADYMRTIGFAPQQQERSFAGTALPQVFADQLGWHDFTRQVVDAWERMPASDRTRTAILLDNYGEAAALDIYGRPAGLPPSLSGHNQYGLWGMRGQAPANVVLVKRDYSGWQGECAELVPLAVTQSRFAMAYENGKTVVLCRGLKRPLAALWPQIRHLD